MRYFAARRRGIAISNDVPGVAAAGRAGPPRWPRRRARPGQPRSNKAPCASRCSPPRARALWRCPGAASPAWATPSRAATRPTPTSPRRASSTGATTRKRWAPSSASTSRTSARPARPFRASGATSARTSTRTPSASTRTASSSCSASTTRSSRGTRTTSSRPTPTWWRRRSRTRRASRPCSSPRPTSPSAPGQERVIQCRFNVSVPHARVSELAPTLRERSER